MTQYAFYFDSTRCTGCKTCELACKDYKDLDQNIAYRKVFDYERRRRAKTRRGGTYETTCLRVPLSPMSCNHCDNPACIAGVSDGLPSHKDPETGLVSVDADKCIGCGVLRTWRVPTTLPRWTAREGHSVKCDGCAERVASWQEARSASMPARCARWTSARSRRCRQRATRANIAPLPESSYTRPNLYIKPCDEARVPPAALMVPSST